jgi:Cupin
MDPLADILRDLRLERSFYACSDLRAPWGLSFNVQDGPSFHVVVSGRCWLRLGAERFLMETDDIVLLPHGEDHELGDAPEGPATPLSALPSIRIGENACLLKFGGSGEESLLICSGVRFEGPVAHPLIELLPRVLLLRLNEQEQAKGCLGTTLSMLGAEALSLRAGSYAVMIRLADVLVLQTIRAWLEQDATRQQGWLAALRDPEIGQARGGGRAATPPDGSTDRSRPWPSASLQGFAL